MKIKAARKHAGTEVREMPRITGNGAAFFDDLKWMMFAARWDVEAEK
jgi:hypothetical protein